MHAYVHTDRHIVNLNPNLEQHIRNWIFGLHHFSQPLKLHQGGCLGLCRPGAGMELQPSSRTPCTPLGFSWHHRDCSTRPASCPPTRHVYCARCRSSSRVIDYSGINWSIRLLTRKPYLQKYVLCVPAEWWSLRRALGHGVPWLLTALFGGVVDHAGSNRSIKLVAVRLHADTTRCRGPFLIN